MPVSNNSIHYVKFVRGLASAWENLQQKNDDTLYFIYESNNNPKQGKLYLGEKLISGYNEGGSISGDINIEDIGDIYIDNQSLANKQILVYNNETEKWENTSLSTIIDTAVGIMQGATAAAAGKSGLVPSPQVGDQDKFLKGDGTWAFTPTPTFNADIFSVDNNNVSLNGFSSTSVGNIPIKTNSGLNWVPLPSGRLNREIITMNELNARLDGTSSTPIDLDTIYMVSNGNDSSTENVYDEYMVINNRLERLGAFGQVDLTNYVTNNTFQSTISVLENILYDTVNPNTGDTAPGLINRVSTIENNYITQAQIGNLSNLILSTGNTTMVEEVNTINTELDELSERLLWHELTANNE